MLCRAARARGGGSLRSLLTRVPRQLSVSTDVTAAIGNTPLVQLKRIVGPECKAKRVLAKLCVAIAGSAPRCALHTARLKYLYATRAGKCRTRVEA